MAYRILRPSPHPFPNNGTSSHCALFDMPFLFTGDQTTITPEDLEGQFQAIRRLVASKAGFQA